MKLTRTRLGMALVAATIAVTGSVAAGVTPAYAEDDPGQGGHCVENMIEPSQICFSTVEEADAYLSRVAETLPDKPSGQTAKGLFGPTTSVSPSALAVKIFRGYDFQNYNAAGGTLTVIALSGPCSLPFNPWDYQLDLTRIFGGRWNNDISSYHDYSICWTNLFDGAFWTGASRGYVPDSPTLGVWNNRASSIRWT